MSDFQDATDVKAPNKNQRLFIDYILFILVDLTVLNLFDEFGVHLHIESFTISLAVAALLQVLLRLTLMIEHRIAAYFKKQKGKAAKVKRIMAAWAVLFISKFVILEVIDVVFGTTVEFFSIIGFIIVVIVIVVVERWVIRIYTWLGND